MTVSERRWIEPSDCTSRKMTRSLFAMKKSERSGDSLPPDVDEDPRIELGAVEEAARVERPRPPLLAEPGPENDPLAAGGELPILGNRWRPPGRWARGGAEPSSGTVWRRPMEAPAVSGESRMAGREIPDSTTSAPASKAVN